MNRKLIFISICLFLLFLDGCVSMVEKDSIETERKKRFEVLKNFNFGIGDKFIYVENKTTFGNIDTDNLYTKNSCKSEKGSGSIIFSYSDKQGHQLIQEIRITARAYWNKGAILIYKGEDEDSIPFREFSGVSKETIVHPGLYSYDKYLKLLAIDAIYKKYNIKDNFYFSYVFRLGRQTLVKDSVYLSNDRIIINADLGNSHFGAFVPRAPIDPDIIFILRGNVRVGQIIRGNAILKYLGSTEAVTTAGFVRVLPYFELLGFMEY